MLLQLNQSGHVGDVLQSHKMFGISVHQNKKFTFQKPEPRDPILDVIVQCFASRVLVQINDCSLQLGCETRLPQCLQQSRFDIG
jgi:hypothetical protein